MDDLNFKEEILFSFFFVLVFVSVEKEMNCLKVMARRKSLYLLEMTYLRYKRNKKFTSEDSWENFTSGNGLILFKATKR